MSNTPTKGLFAFLIGSQVCQQRPYLKPEYWRCQDAPGCGCCVDEYRQTPHGLNRHPHGDANIVKYSIIHICPLSVCVFCWVYMWSVECRKNGGGIQSAETTKTTKDGAVGYSLKELAPDIHKAIVRERVSISWFILHRFLLQFVQKYVSLPMSSYKSGVWLVVSKVIVCNADYHDISK